MPLKSAETMETGRSPPLFKTVPSVVCPTHPDIDQRPPMQTCIMYETSTPCPSVSFSFCPAKEANPSLTIPVMIAHHSNKHCDPNVHILVLTHLHVRCQQLKETPGSSSSTYFFSNRTLCRRRSDTNKCFLTLWMDNGSVQFQGRDAEC